MSRISQGARGRRWLMMTSSTIVFSTTGVSAAIACPTIDMPNATNTLRLWAMRNGHRRRNHPPASGGAGSGVGRSAGLGRLTGRTMALLHRSAQCVETVDHDRAIVTRRPQHRLELGGHRPLALLQRSRALGRDPKADPPAIAFDVDALHPLPRLETVEQPGQRKTRDSGLLSPPAGPFRLRSDPPQHAGLKP